MKKILCPNPDTLSELKWMMLPVDESISHKACVCLESIGKNVEFGIYPFFDKDVMGFGQGMAIYCQEVRTLNLPYELNKYGYNYKQATYNTVNGFFMFENSFVHKAKDLYLDKYGRVWIANFEIELLPSKNSIKKRKNTIVY